MNFPPGPAVSLPPGRPVSPTILAHPWATHCLLVGGGGWRVTSPLFLQLLQILYTTRASSSLPMAWLLPKVRNARPFVTPERQSAAPSAPQRPSRGDHTARKPALHLPPTPPDTSSSGRNRCGEISRERAAVASQVGLPPEGCQTQGLLEVKSWDNELLSQLLS